MDGVKEKLLQFLLQHSQNMLLSTGCPIDKVRVWARGMRAAENYALGDRISDKLSLTHVSDKCSV